jgi:hypothetical protein
MRVATQKMTEARKAAAVTFTSLAYKHVGVGNSRGAMGHYPESRPHAAEVNQENDNQHDKHDDERTGRLLKQQKQKQQQQQNRGTRMLLQSNIQPNMTSVNATVNTTTQIGPTTTPPPSSLSVNSTGNTTSSNSTFTSNTTQPNITSQGGNGNVNGNVNGNASGSTTPAGTPKPVRPKELLGRAHTHTAPLGIVCCCVLFPHFPLDSFSRSLNLAQT